MEYIKQRLIHGDNIDLFNAVSLYITHIIQSSPNFNKDNSPFYLVNTKSCYIKDEDIDEDGEENEIIVNNSSDNEDEIYNIKINKKLSEGYDYSFIFKENVFKCKVIKKSENPITVSHHVYTLLQDIVIESNAEDSIFDELIKEANKYYRTKILNLNYKTKEKINIRIWDDEYWSLLDTCSKRDISTVYHTKEVKDKIFNKIKSFTSKKTKMIYKYLGIPYKLNLLFEGPPGCGKTTTIKAIASILDYCLNILTFDLNTSDTKFMRAIKEIRPKTVLVLEDIDCLFVERKSNDSNKNMITFSSLLNVLDGLSSKEGLIVIMTSNYKNNLDDALIRPGRIDSIIHFDYMKKDQIEQMFMKFIFCSEDMDNQKTTPDEKRTELFDTFYKDFKRLNIEVSCSLMQQYLFQYVDDQENVTKNVNQIKKIQQDTKKEKANMYM